MSDLRVKYQESGIWTMATPRQSCVVPERPLLISTDEEYELNKLSLSVWKAVETLLEMADINPKAHTALVNAAAPFPEGLTMPPAIRVDTVRTIDGPKIVEVDPVTAISLGETASLIDIWQAEGYGVPTGLVDTVQSTLIDSGVGIAVSLPSAKSAYKGEVEYFVETLQSRGIAYDDAGVQMSAFNDAAAVRRRINRDGWRGDRNPLWGSLVGLAGKNNLGMLIGGDKVDLPRYLAEEYAAAEATELDSDTLLVAKPLNGTGSIGVVAMRAGEVDGGQRGVVYQRQLDVMTDNFGLEGEWVSRVSLYAGKYGLLGAQVTARRKEGAFTNVHGQSDAMQTTLAVTRDVA